MAVSADLVRATAARLADPGARLLRALSSDRLWAAWKWATTQLLDRRSSQRQALLQALPGAVGLSPAGTGAALDTVIAPLAGEQAKQLIHEARPGRPSRPALVVLAGNVPGLALQPLLPALAARRPVLFKCARGERWITPTFLELLASFEPNLGASLASLYWPGGESEIDRCAASACHPIAVYGHTAAIAAWRRLAGQRLLAFSPKLSVAIVSSEVDLEPVCAGIARDTALFDQRGCLSVQLLLTDAPPERVARALARALEEVATELEPGVHEPRAAAAAAALRDRAILLGRPVEGEVGRGLVVVCEPPLQPSPGLRVVRLYPVAALAQAIELLRPVREKLQGAVLAGTAARALAGELEELGVSRWSGAGELQRPGARWNNGGIDLLASFGATIP